MLCGETQSDWTSPEGAGDARIDTLTRLLRHIAGRHPDAGIYVVDQRGRQEFRTYAQILQSARRVGAALRVEGLGPRDTVVLVQSTGFDFLAAFFGALTIGATPVPVAPPASHADASGPPVFVTMARRLDARAIIADAGVETAGVGASSSTGALAFVGTVPVLLEDMPTAAGVEAQTSVPNSAYIQLTSGTTGPMRAVELTHANILSNAHAIGQALQVSRRDVGVSWTPPYNPMGLVGVICFGLYWGLDMVMIAPERFLRHPEEWLDAISRHQATLSTAPNFGYHYAVRRCQESDLEGLDLSSWRVAMSGAEPVRAQHIDGFIRRFGTYGLREDLFLPVYGLAEATLGVSFAELGQRVQIDGVNRRVFERQGRAEPLPDAGAQSPAERLHLVSVGRPLDGVDVKIVDDKGVELDDRRRGEVCARGPNIMSAYVDDPPEADHAAPTCLVDDWLYTGDIGYIADGRLYVVGRRCDTFETARGRTVFPDEVELFVNSVDGVRGGSAVAFCVAAPADAAAADNSTPQVLVVAYELQAGTAAGEVNPAVKDLVQTHLGLDPHALVALSAGSVPKTHSGKVRRRAAQTLYGRDCLERRQRAGRFQRVERLVGHMRRKAGRFRDALAGQIGRWLGH